MKKHDLRSLRVQAGITQEELAKRVGVEQPAIAKYESGDMLPRLNVAIKLQMVFPKLKLKTFI